MRKAVKKTEKTEWELWVPMWLHGRPESTRNMYTPVIKDFAKFVRHKPVSQVELKDIQNYADAFTGHQKPRTINRKTTTIRSLLKFCEETGLIQFNVGRGLRSLKIVDNLSERILSQADTLRVIATDTVPRDHVLKETLYLTGIRASEAAALRWMDTAERDHDEGQITVLGKGGKTRSIRLPAPLWEALQSIRPSDAQPMTPVFAKANGKAMSRTHISTVVARAAKQAGIPNRVSAHWMRHAHATHALEAGAPISLISQTLGHTSIATTGRYLHVRPGESSSSFLPTFERCDKTNILFTKKRQKQRG